MNFAELTIAAKQIRDTIAKNQAVINACHANLAILLKQCTHDERIPMSSYSDGGYGYRSESVIWDRCNLCGHESNIKTRYGSYS